MQKTLLGLAAILACAWTSPASAAIVYTTVASAFTYENAFGPGPMLDDVTLSAPNATIGSITFGARNVDSTIQTVDLLVSFFDEADVNAVGSTTVESGLIATVRVPGIVVPASGTNTYTVFLATPVVIPDNDAAVRMSFVTPATTTVVDTVDALLASDLPTVGSSADKFWSDAGTFNQTFVGDEAVAGDVSLHANFYLQLDTAVIPEPTLPLLALGGLLLRRRR